MTFLQWTGAVALSLIVHVTLASLLLESTNSGSGSAVQAGESGLKVGLGMAGSYADIRAAEIQHEETESTEEQPEPETEQAQQPKRPKEKALPEVAPPELPPTPKETFVESIEATRNLALGQQLKNDTPEEIAERTPNPQSEPSFIKELSSKAAASRPAQQKATGRASSHKSGAKKGDNHHYFGEIMAWLGQHKRYPAELKKKKIEGVVILQFRINRHGHVLTSEIKKGSGHHELDQSALAMLTNASPLPAMPDWMKRDTLTLAIPIEYSLITNRSYKE